MPRADPSRALTKLKLHRLALRPAEQLPFPKYADTHFPGGVSGEPGDCAIRLGGPDERAFWYQTRSMASWAAGFQLRREERLFFPAGAGTVEAWFKSDWKPTVARANGKADRCPRERQGRLPSDRAVPGAPELPRVRVQGREGRHAAARLPSRSGRAGAGARGHVQDEVCGDGGAQAAGRRLVPSRRAVGAGRRGGGVRGRPPRAVGADSELEGAQPRRRGDQGPERRERAGVLPRVDVAERARRREVESRLAVLPGRGGSAARVHRLPVRGRLHAAAHARLRSGHARAVHVRPFVRRRLRRRHRLDSGHDAVALRGTRGPHAGDRRTRGAVLAQGRAARARPALRVRHRELPRAAHAGRLRGGAPSLCEERRAEVRGEAGAGVSRQGRHRLRGDRQRLRQAARLPDRAQRGGRRSAQLR